jgi:hypothetical protein
MTYSVGNLIQATDYNTFVGGNPTTTANALNTVWATGGGQAGYGQTAVANVTAGNPITAAAWNSLFYNTGNAASHQGTTITAISNVSVGSSVAFNSALTNNLANIYTSRGNAAAQGSTTANTVAFGSTWSNSLTVTQTVTFANGDAARYFFNAGGQIKMTVSHANATAGINALFNTLCTNVGTLVISGQNSGSRQIAGTSYTGVQKVGGGGNAPSPYLTNNGYFALTTSNANIFTQTATGAPAGYVGSFITFIAKSNGVQGSNADVGNVITIYTVWDEVPNGLTVGTGSTTTLTIVPPATTYIANTWGSITLGGSASGA